MLRQENQEVQGGNNNIVFIPCIMMDANKDDFPIPLWRLQFPVHLAFSMTINKAQEQSVKHIELDLHIFVFSHGQLYVALSRCTNPRNLRVVFPPDQRILFFASLAIIY